MKKIYDNKKLILIIGGILILILLLVLYFVNDKESEDDIVLNITTEKLTIKQEEKESFYVDVKGESELVTLILNV